MRKKGIIGQCPGTRCDSSQTVRAGDPLEVHIDVVLIDTGTTVAVATANADVDEILEATVSTEIGHVLQIIVWTRCFDVIVWSFVEYFTVDQFCSVLDFISQVCNRFECKSCK